MSRRRADMSMLTWGNIALLSAGRSSGCPALAVQDPPIVYELGLALSKMGEEIAPRLLWSNQRGLPFTRPRRGPRRVFGTAVSTTPKVGQATAALSLGGQVVPPMFSAAY